MASIGGVLPLGNPLHARLASPAFKTRARTTPDRIIGASLFAILVVLNVIVPSWGAAGVPFRTLLPVALLPLLALLYPMETTRAFHRWLMLVVLAGGLAVLGIFISLVNGAPLADVTQKVAEVHLQAVATLLVAAVLAELCGARPCVLAIVGVIAISTLYAVLQMLGADFAWATRNSLGPVAHEELGQKVVRRPTGLSYSPVQLATQLCLAFGAFTALRDKEQRSQGGLTNTDPVILLAVLLLVAGSFVIATRSPILGAVAFVAAYFATRRGSWLPLAFLLGGALLYAAWPLIMDALQVHGGRLVRVDDSSAESRFVFGYFGIRLFLENPLGYGLTFDPSQLWVDHWSELYTMRAASAAQEYQLHNYLLSILNIYGIGLLLLVPIAAQLLLRARSSLIFFVPYGVHIMLHNSGPFYSDVILWLLIPAVAAGGSGAAQLSGAFIQERSRAMSRSLRRSAYRARMRRQTRAF